ncbi:MAG TPA: poly-beta-1,6-N-acetyl-D-glucosamine N-deacetylase PgaB, partial [Paenalcaligenes sp.]|nr:poly-beta-1,6-N-acetyl-D-glucosamine N-deacetylase PgaB [Paenalcaligenes sp.]
MPRMEGVAKRDEDLWIRRVVDEVAKRPTGLEKTIFEIQARDWNAPPEKQHIPTRTLVHWMEVLQRAGARHFGYYPDDFLLNQPNLHEIRPAISNEWFPFKQ